VREDTSVNFVSFERGGLIFGIGYGLDGMGIEVGRGVRFSAPFQTGPGAHSVFCTMGTGSFPGVKRPGRAVDHPSPSSANIKERLSYNNSNQMH